MMTKTHFVLSIFLLSLTTELIAQQTIQSSLAALTKNTNGLEETDRITRLAGLYRDYRIVTYPELATFTGKAKDNSTWTDFSGPAIEQRKKDRLLFLIAIRSIHSATLSAADQLNYSLLKYELELEKEGEAFESELMPINQMTGYHQRVMQVANATSFTSKKDVDDFVSRLQKIPALVDQLILLMDEGIKKNITQPKTTLMGVPEQIQNIIGNDSARSPLLKGLTDYLAKQSNPQKAFSTGRAQQVMSEHVTPALSKLKSYMEQTYIPKARQTIALKDLPNGANWYNYNIKVQTTTALTYQQIHETGLSEVKRIRRSMDSLIVTTGFKGSFNEFITFLRTDDQFYYDTPAQLLDGYRIIAKKIDGELPKYFGKLPRLPYGVIAVPAYEEKSQTTAYYIMGSSEAGRAGYFYANTYALKSRPKWEMEALTIHEAVPGHHLQFALAEELENVPEFRKYSRYNSFIEGWGLYSESLGVEMGFYKDPYSKFGQLTYEMWRAVRLVVDTGIHGMGWTRQQSIDYFKANAAKTEHDITVEVDRYIGWPGQALSYKMGELKLKELRARAEKKLGNKFDIRKFHDVVLANGAVPLNILEVQVNEWINSIK
ncbi:DUF885 domain-containing protein [Nostoc sp. CHAB 5834]|nr:DUF885 domain-containing protein [Nostoc sp. CHAB 5834]